MGQLSFFIAIVAACLLWSAAFTAAAARTRPGWLRWILLAAALIAPPLALAPLVLITGGFAVLGFETNWFAATFTSLLAAAIGGAWIVIAGLAPRATPAAAAWPLGGLAAMCVLAKAVAAGILLIIDSDVAAEGRRLRIEAAEIVAAALPPAPAPDDDAAPLYQRAFAAIAADTSLDAPQSAFWTSLMTDAETPQVAAILARHVATLDLLRRAADKPGCRFDRDWSRLSIDMQLPEIREMRQASLLLMLAARTAAADGDGAEALADVVHIHRLGMHVAGEPLLVSGLVGRALDAVAIQTLADVLPRLERDDLPRLDAGPVREIVGPPMTFQRAFLGEEALGLATLAGLADGTRETSTLAALRGLSAEPTERPFDEPLSLLYRCFLLPADITTPGIRDQVATQGGGAARRSRRARGGDASAAGGRHASHCARPRHDPRPAPRPLHGRRRSRRQALGHRLGGVLGRARWRGRRRSAAGGLRCRRRKRRCGAEALRHLAALRASTIASDARSGTAWPLVPGTAHTATGLSRNASAGLPPPSEPGGRESRYYREHPMVDGPLRRFGVAHALFVGRSLRPSGPLFTRCWLRFRRTDPPHGGSVPSFTCQQRRLSGHGQSLTDAATSDVNSIMLGVVVEPGLVDEILPERLLLLDGLGGPGRFSPGRRRGILFASRVPSPRCGGFCHDVPDDPSSAGRVRFRRRPDRPDRGPRR